MSRHRSASDVPDLLSRFTSLLAAPSPPSLDVYHKRTAVFDTIQAFIADPTQKEPEGDLAIMVDARLGPLIV